MNDEVVQKIRSNPKYQELVKKRTGFAVKLGIFVLAMYYTYILVIAFNPSVLAAKISEDAVMTVAFPVGAGIIIVSFITTIIYVIRANGEFEQLNNQVKDDIKDSL
jgi:uncharacterized membrane protein (DUF485 family)